MGGDKKNKHRKREKVPEFSRGSGVDYSKVADRHIDDARFEKHRGVSVEPSAAVAGATSAAIPSAAAAGQPKQQMSAQMDAVFRLMTGQEERTIAQKLADSNRPTWEQYKKDNEDKLNIMGLDQKKMDEYRKQLDEERDKILSRGTNHGAGSKKEKKKRRSKHRGDSDDSSSDDYSSSDSDRRRRRKKKHKKKKDRRHKKKHKRHRHSSSSSESDDDHSDDENDSRRKRHKKEKKKKRKKDSKENEADSDGEHYRLSNFFTHQSDDDSD